MKPRGFTLATVVLLLALMAVAVFLVTRAAGTGVDRADKSLDFAAARYTAEAGMTHALWLAQNSACLDYALPATSFGAHTYQAAFNPTASSPVVVKAVGTSDSGAVAQVSRFGVPVYDGTKPQTLTIQFDATTGKDSTLDDFYSTRNFGGASYLAISSAPGWTTRPLIEVDVSAIPAGAKVLSAQLELKQQSVTQPGLASVYRLTRSWQEGTKNGGGIADGATWQAFDGGSAWTQAGGDFDPTLYAATSVSSAGNGQKVVWEVRDLVQLWVSGAPNHGLMLAGDGALNNANFASRDTNNPTDAPKFTVTYVCECGQVCGGGGGAGSLLMVVVDPASPTSQEQARKALIESWGYTVNLIDEAANQSSFDAAVAANDIAYVPETIDGTLLGTKLTGATTGVVIEERTSAFGVATNFESKSRDEIDIIDNSHYITEQFTPGLMTFLSSLQPVTKINSGLAPDLQTLGEVFNTGSLWSDALAVIETGGALAGGGAAAGRRVQLPWGAPGFDINALNADGQIIMQRAIEWAAGAGGPGCTTTTPLLFVVSDASSPTAQETARQALLESWCYAVVRIDDGATQAQYDADAAVVDVVYVSPEVLATQVGTKLRGIGIGVVNEDPELHTTFGFSTVRYQGLTNAPLKTDATHEITAPFAGGLVTLFTSDQPAGGAVGTLAAGLHTIGSWSSGDLAPLGGLLTLEAGAAISGGGSAAGRRVQMPWDGQDGLSVADIDALTADGETILQRSLQWAADSGGGGGGSPPSGVKFETFAEANSNSDSLTLSVPAPAGTVSGDLLIAAVATDGLQASAMTAPAGWSLIDHGDQSAEVTLNVWWKLADGAEPASYDFSWVTAQKSYGWVMRFTGHDPINPISISSITGGSSNAPLSPAVITTAVDSLILRVGGFDDDDINSGSPGLSGHIPIAMGKSGNGNGTVSGGAGYFMQPAIGDSGTSTFWLNATEEYRTVTIAIAPN